MRDAEEAEYRLIYRVTLAAVHAHFRHLPMAAIMDPPRSWFDAALAQQVVLHVMCSHFNVTKQRVLDHLRRSRASLNRSLTTIDWRLDTDEFEASYRLIAAHAQRLFEDEKAAGCTTRLTHKYAVVCPDHYFCVEPKEVSFVRTLMIRADRTRDAETQQRSTDMSSTKSIPLDKIHVPARLRDVEDDHALAIQASIQAHGLINPITVRQTPNGEKPYTLVAGAHRLRAIELLDKDNEIEVVVVKADADDAVLIEITENLFRNDLSVMDRATFVATYRDVWEKTHGPIKAGNPQLDQVDPIGSSPVDLIAQEHANGFSKVCAERLGVSVPSIKRLNQIAQNLTPDLRAAVRGTSIADNQAQLLSLAKLDPALKPRAAEKLRDHKGDFKAAWPDITGHKAQPTDQQKILTQMIRLYAKASPKTKAAFRDHLDKVQTREAERAANGGRATRFDSKAKMQAGSLELERFRSEVKRAMSEAIRQCGLPRSVVAERMAAYLGLPKLSRATLDAYTAESKDTHDISLLRFAAFVHATSAPWLYDLIASKAGCTVLQGREARLAEMALLEQMEATGMTLKRFYTAEELAILHGTSARHVHRLYAACRRNAKLARQESGKRGRGGGAWTYHFDALNGDVQARLMKVHSTPGNDDARCDHEAAQPSHLWAHYNGLPKARKKACEARLNAVVSADRLISEGLSQRTAFEQVAHDHRCSAKSLANWMARVTGKPRKDWLALMADQYKAGGKRAECHPEAWETLKSDYLRPERPTFSACVRRVRLIARDNGWLPMPTEASLRRRFEHEVPKAVVIAARETSERTKRLYPAQRRDRSALRAMQAVNIDGHKFDVFVSVPWRDNPIRPMMIAIQCLYSGKILAWRIAETENKDTTRLAIGDMVTRHGIPEKMLLDNGRAFASKWITGGAMNRFRFKVKEEDPNGLLVSLGVELIWAQPYSGQSKPIERAFRDLTDTISRHPVCAGAWTGNDVNAKPENYRSKAVPIDVFKAHVDREIAEHNARAGRKGGNANGRSFDETFAQSLADPATIVSWPTEGQRSLWLMAAESIRAQRGSGEIHLAGNRYWNEALNQFMGKKLVVRFDADRLHEPVKVYDLSDRFICDAACIEDAGFFSMEDALQHNRDRRAFLKKKKELADMHVQMSPDQLADIYTRNRPNPKPTPEPRTKRVVTKGVMTGGRTALARKPAPEAWGEDHEDAFANAMERLEGEISGWSRPDTVPETGNEASGRTAADISKWRALTERVLEIAELNGWSKAEVGRRIQMPDGTFSQWFSGKYTGRLDSQNLKVERWLSSTEEMAGMAARVPSGPDFVKTKTAKQIIATLQFAQAMPTVVIVTTPSGTGKTAACTHYASTRANVFMVTMNPYARTVHATLTAMATQLGVTQMNPAKLHSAVIRRLTSADRTSLLIVDEAQNLDHQSLNMLRELKDLHGCGVAIVGNDEIHTRLRRDSLGGEHNQVTGRIGKRLRFSTPRLEDIEAVLDAWNMREPQARKFLTGVAMKNGSLHQVRETIGLASLTLGDGETLSADHLKAAWANRDVADLWQGANAIARTVADHGTPDGLTMSAAEALHLYRRLAALTEAISLLEDELAAYRICERDGDALSALDDLCLDVLEEGLAEDDEDLANLAQMIDHRRRDKVPPSDALLHELARALECHGGRAREMERRVEDLEAAPACAFTCQTETRQDAAASCDRQWWRTRIMSYHAHDSDATMEQLAELAAAKVMDKFYGTIRNQVTREMRAELDREWTELAAQKKALARTSESCATAKAPVGIGEGLLKACAELAVAVNAFEQAQYTKDENRAADRLNEKAAACRTAFRQFQHAADDVLDRLGDGTRVLDGRVYMNDARGGVMPMEAVKAAEKLEDEMVRREISFAIALSDQIDRFRNHVMQALVGFDGMLEQHYDVRRGGKKGNRQYTSYDGLLRIEVQVADLIDFGPQLHIAKALVDECLIEWSAEGRAEVRSAVTQAFNTDKKGKINRSAVLMLLRIDSDDERWMRAMDAIRDAIRIIGSKEYVRFYQRAKITDGWKAVTIDLAKAGA
ncbi:unnamed protein product [Effrenium voratum]|uniref:Integrase catalytic domain-containing protein n=1 Tax=Effrenium voratum TaxID=2562239 RepID=A0AA36IQJ7_9DINO|nr:unnamed protein product [Effrenium voratum]